MNIALNGPRMVSAAFGNDLAAVNGGFWHMGKYYTGTDACGFLYRTLGGGMKRAQDYGDIIRSFNGAFAFCVKTGAFVLAAVDRVRSIPLYYSRDAIADRLPPDGPIDPAGRIELLSAGYTVNGRTVRADWSGLQPGEFLLIPSDARAMPDPVRYFAHTHHIDEASGEREIENRFLSVSERVISNAVRSLNGKKVMIGLSGGYDSRYVACMLKEYGVDRVVAYTYGKASSYEVRTSKAVAEKLGFEWNFVEYTDALWEQILNGGVGEEFLRFGFMGDGNPCYQEIPALYELAKKYGPDEYCILPGYCGDLFGGSYRLPAEYERMTPDDLAAYLYGRHFMFRRNRRSEKKTVLRDIRDGLGIGGPVPYAAAAGVNEDWFVRHKVAKFVVNAVRMFEYFGYDWRLPLWDNELLSLWYSVPLTYRGISRNLYKELLFRDFFEKYGIGLSKPASFSKKPSRGPLKYAKRVVKKINAFCALNMGFRFLPEMDINNANAVNRYMLDRISDRKRLNYGYLDTNAYIARRVVEGIEKGT